MLNKLNTIIERTIEDIKSYSYFHNESCPCMFDEPDECTCGTWRFIEDKLRTFATAIQSSVEAKHKRRDLGENVRSGCCDAKIREDEKEQHYCMECNKHMGGKVLLK